MSYATLLDALFALELADSTLEEESTPVTHPEEPADEPRSGRSPGETSRQRSPVTPRAGADCPSPHLIRADFRAYL